MRKNRPSLKIKSIVRKASSDLKRYGFVGCVRLWVEDEASFGRINKPKYCWCPKGVRPVVPCQHIRQYCQPYGACEPLTGEKFFRIFEKCNTDSFEIYLEMLSDLYPDDYHVMLCDRASWHVSEDLSIPENVEIVNIPPGTPEMNPMEQIWRELRTRGFHNRMFDSIDEAIDQLCKVIRELSPETVKSITGREWFLSML